MMTFQHGRKKTEVFDLSARLPCTRLQGSTARSETRPPAFTDLMDPTTASEGKALAL